MPSTRYSLAELSALTLVIALIALEGGVWAEKPIQLVPGCYRKGHLVTCRAWSSPDAPDIPSTFPWRDFLVLDLSSMDAAKKLDMMTRGGSCDKQVRAQPPQGLGAALHEGRLPARWLNARYSLLIVLYLRGAGLRAVHRDAFEMLTGVQHVYLGSNMLESLDPDLWRHNSHLTGVSLENNMGLQLPEDGPLFNSDSVENLDLAGCGLRDVPAGAFDGLPRLQMLRLERNCLRVVPAQALVPVSDLWAVKLGENAIESLSAEAAQLLARLPDAMMHGNPWRCDCALRNTVRALEGETRSFWEQSMLDLVCMWPPEDVERPWAEVLTRNNCRVYNESLENSSFPRGPGTHFPTLPPPPNATEAENPAAAHFRACGGCGTDGDAVFCRWTAGGVLLLLVLGLVVFVVAAFTNRLSVTISVAGARRERKAQRNLSQANLTERDDDVEYLHDEANDLGGRDGENRRFVVHF